jgi:hypothetical protein
VLVDFWTTPVATLCDPAFREEVETKYKDPGLVMIRVHTPEFSFVIAE